MWGSSMLYKLMFCAFITREKHVAAVRPSAHRATVNETLELEIDTSDTPAAINVHTNFVAFLGGHGGQTGGQRQTPVCCLLWCPCR